MNSKFKSSFISNINITDSEISYKVKEKTEIINVSDIQVFDVVEGTISKYGYIKIIENGVIHTVQFLVNYNKDIRAWQERLGFTNQMEPMSVKELETVYNREIVEGGVKLHISDAGVSYKVFKNEGFIKASRIKSVEFKAAKIFSLGLIIIYTFTDNIEIKITTGFNKPIEKWIEDIETGVYRINWKEREITNPTPFRNIIEQSDVNNCVEEVNNTSSKRIDKKESIFGNWDKDIHFDYEQVDRILKAKDMSNKIIYINKNTLMAKIQGSEIEPYNTTLDSCECIDFERRGLPCKHMYALAFEIGSMNWLPEYKSRGSAFNADIEIEKYKIFYKRGDISAETYTKICSVIAKTKKKARKK